MSATSLLPPELLAMMARGVSVIVGSRDQQLRPSVMRAVGSSVSPDASSITVYVSRDQSRQLIQDIAANGPVAVVFCEPASHRTVQFKASRAAIRKAEAADEPVLQRYLASMEHEIELVGFPAYVTRAMLAYRLEDVVAITLEPEQAFDQTPGPRAGTRLGAPK